MNRLWLLLTVLAWCQLSCSQELTSHCADAEKGEGEWRLWLRPDETATVAPVWDGAQMQEFYCLPTGCRACRVNLEEQSSACSPVAGTRLTDPGFAATQDHAFVIGGKNGPTGNVSDKAWLFDWATESWAALPVPSYFRPASRYYAYWTGREFLAWSAYMVTEDVARGTGVAYSPATGEWRELPTEGAPTSFVDSVWTDAGLVVWPFDQDEHPAILRDGEEWEPLASEGLPKRQCQKLATSGRHLFVVGGVAGCGQSAKELRQIDVYDTETGTWEDVDIPSDMHVGRPVWVDDRLYMATYPCEGFSFFEPADESWGVTTSVGAPSSPGSGYLLAADDLLVQVGINDGHEMDGHVRTFRSGSQ